MSTPKDKFLCRVIISLDELEVELLNVNVEYIVPFVSLG